MRVAFAILLGLATITCGCQVERRKSDAELGLNPTQAAGRRVYDQRCGSCHEAYSSRDLRGPSLQHIFQKQYLPSGTPANDDRVRDVIELGRAKMPGFGRVLTPQQVEELMTYLHTL